MDQRSTPAHKRWKEVAVAFQNDKFQKFRSRSWDQVENWDLGKKIDAALGEVEYKNKDVEKLAKAVLGMRDDYYYVRFIYVNVKSDEDYKDYECDVVCVIRNRSSTIWIDINCRTYKSWEDYLENNTLPKGLMCYPEDGKYEAGNRIMTNLTPAAQFKALALEALDNAAQVVGTVADIVTVASIVAFPAIGFAALGRTLLKKVVKRAVVASVISHGYTTTRNGLKIADRYRHNQSISLSNAEARELWVNAAIYGFSTVTAGMSISALRTGCTLVCGAARSAIIVNCGLSVFRVNLILALDACYTDSSYGKMNMTNFIRNCYLYFNIFSPHHVFVETLKEIDELTSFLKIIAGKSRDYLKLVGYQLDSTCGTLVYKPVAFIKDLIQIVGKFIMNMRLSKFELLINQLRTSINCLLTGNSEKFDLMMSEVGSEILSAFQEPWREAEKEIYKYGNSKEDLFKRSDLDDEDVRNIFSMLHSIEKCYKLESGSMQKLINIMNVFLSKLPVVTCNRSESGSMQKLINIMNVFLSKLPVVTCNRSEYIKRVKGFCLFLEKEVENKIVEHYERRKLIATISDQQNISLDMENDSLKSNCCRQVIDNFDIEKCVGEYNRCSSSSSVASIEACGITQYLFVEDKTELTDSEYLNILEEKTSGMYNFDHAVVARKGNIVHIESIDEEAMAIFYTQRMGRIFSEKLEGVLTCIEKKHFQKLGSDLH